MTVDTSISSPYHKGQIKHSDSAIDMSADAQPWRETPLVESANLSKAAGWYGTHYFSLSIHKPV